MPVLETRRGICQDCGHSMTLVVYWPHVVMLRKILEMGALQELDDDDLEALFADAASLDEHDQDIDGELDMSVDLIRGLLTDAVVVNGGKEQVVVCPGCRAVIGVVARERVG